MLWRPREVLFHFPLEGHMITMGGKTKGTKFHLICKHIAQNYKDLIQ